jgi:superfamily II DNA or RNA helicase
LLNCEKLSQGIDVKSVNNIILFATPKGRQLIQRLGRVLRSDLINNPEKRACVIDFYEENDMLLEKGPEYERYKKLKKWSLTRKK